MQETEDFTQDERDELEALRVEQPDHHPPR
jgi:hypothetical protein